MSPLAVPDTWPGVFVSADALEAFLGLAPDTDRALLALLTRNVEAAFHVACGRAHAPFAPPLTGRVERHDGTGRPELWLDYPVATVTTVRIDGVAVPAAVLRWRPDSARLRRTDSGTFGAADAAGAVEVTYDTADDRPDIAGIPLLRVIAAIYRQLGSEDAASERMASTQVELVQLYRHHPEWAVAVAACRRVEV